MAVAGVHPHGSLEVAELLAELAACGEHVLLDHVVLDLEADPQGAALAGLDEGEHLACADHVPLGLVDLAGVEIVGEDELLAQGRIGGEDRRTDQEEEKGEAHGDYFQTLTQSMSTSSGSSLSTSLGRSHSPIRWVNCRVMGAVMAMRSALWICLPFTNQAKPFSVQRMP